MTIAVNYWWPSSLRSAIVEQQPHAAYFHARAAVADALGVFVEEALNSVTPWCLPDPEIVDGSGEGLDGRGVSRGPGCGYLVTGSVSARKSGLGIVSAAGLTGRERAACQALCGMLGSCGAEQVQTHTIQPQPAEPTTEAPGARNAWGLPPDPVAELLAALSCTEFVHVLHTVATQQPSVIASLFSPDQLTPLSAYLLTRKLEAADEQQVLMQGEASIGPAQMEEGPVSDEVSHGEEVPQQPRQAGQDPHTPQLHQKCQQPSSPNTSMPTLTAETFYQTLYGATGTDPCQVRCFGK